MNDETLEKFEQEAREETMIWLKECTGMTYEHDLEVDCEQLEDNLAGVVIRFTIKMKETQ